MYSLPGNAFKFTLGFDPLPLSHVRGELSREPIHVLVVVVAVCREFPTASSNKVGRRKELGEEEEGALILSVSCPTRIVKIQNKSGHYAFLSLSLFLPMSPLTILQIPLFSPSIPLPVTTRSPHYIIADLYRYFPTPFGFWPPSSPLKYSNNPLSLPLSFICRKRREEVQKER